MNRTQRLDSLLLSLKGYSTRKRRAVLQTLTGLKSPVTAKRLHKLMGRGACDLATVHRTLNSLELAGVVHSIAFNGKVRWYELKDQAAHFHHVFCTACERIENIPLCEIDSFAKYAKEKKGFVIKSHMLELFGLCPKCSRETKNQRKRT